MAELKKYGQAATVLFPLIDRDAVDFETAATFVAGDVQIIKDEGAAVNTTNLPAHEGNGIYSLALTATELTAARVVVTVKDQTVPKVWEDQAILVDTYGHASAEHAFDLDLGQQLVTVESMQTDVVSAAAVSAAAAQEIADELLKRPLSSVEPGAVARTAYGAFCALVNRARINASGNLEVYKTDDATVLATMVGTADAALTPIKELDP